MLLELPKTNEDSFDTVETDNGLQAVVISCKNCELSAVSISVNVGSNEDTVPGLCHLLEHLIFYASEEYPAEGYIYSYLAENAGSSNAYTDREEIVFFLSVSNEGLYEALKIFSSLIKNPLLESDGVLREINAVNSEHEKNVYQDE